MYWKSLKILKVHYIKNKLHKTKTLKPSTNIKDNTENYVANSVDLCQCLLDCCNFLHDRSTHDAAKIPYSSLMFVEFRLLLRILRGVYRVFCSKISSLDSQGNKHRDSAHRYAKTWPYTSNRVFFIIIERRAEVLSMESFCSRIGESSRVCCHYFSHFCFFLFFVLEIPGSTVWCLENIYLLQVARRSRAFFRIACYTTSTNKRY